MKRTDVRNVAIIAHVDHGKTTLVNELLKQGGIFRENQEVQDRVMDSGDLERERGITILAKNTSVFYKGVKINIVDTPGHADFGGEVERVLKMVNGVLVLVDACEGPMPQTRFVMQKALELNHKLIIVVNKIDRPDARLSEVQDEILELLFDLNASDEQIDSPIIFCSGREGTATKDYHEQGKDLTPLFEEIINYFEPQEVDEEGPFQMLVSSIDYNEYVGRIGIGRIERGKATVNQDVGTCNYNVSGKEQKGKLVTIYQIEGLNRVPVESAKAGDIVCISGLENISIGDTVCDLSKIEPVPFVKISEPTVEMTFSVNDSPFAGKEGKFVTTRHLRDRLFKEMLKDVSLRVEETDSADSYRVCGRGEMHLSILIETMRRGGYEFQVGAPKVMYKKDGDKLLEPIEKLVVDVPEDKTGPIFSAMGVRKGELLQMENIGSRIRLEFKIPARGLFGYKSQFLTDTRGEGVFNTIFYGYEEYKGDIERRTTGSLVAFETGESVTYGLFNAQGRGQLFIGAGVPVYEGMIVG
ncbi:MAG: translational GTPase TypA, partial [Clostridia bacterium]|nr:translational GTPase TypA [Clostridia bacterium]